MSKISTELNNNPYVGDPHWCAQNANAKRAYDSLTENEKHEFDAFSRKVKDVTVNVVSAANDSAKKINEKILATEKLCTRLADKIAEKLDISKESAEDIMKSNTAFDVFKCSLKDSKEIDKSSTTNESKYGMANFDQLKRLTDDIIRRTKDIKQGEEVVDHPSHYNHGKYECIDVIDDLKLNFNVGSAMKYIWRCGLKDDEITELEKAVWYLEREIANRKAARDGKED